MSSRIGWFVLGIVATLVGIVAGGYLFIRAGGMPMETSAKPLPFEGRIAGMALRASIGNAKDTKTLSMAFFSTPGTEWLYSGVMTR